MIRTVDSSGLRGSQGAPLRRGRVVDARDRPEAGVGVEVVRGTVAAPDVGRLTDEAGWFPLSLPEGRFLVRATAADGRTTELEIEGGSGPPFEIRLAEASGAAPANEGAADEH